MNPKSMNFSSPCMSGEKPLINDQNKRVDRKMLSSRIAIFIISFIFL